VADTKITIHYSHVLQPLTCSSAYQISSKQSNPFIKTFRSKTVLNFATVRYSLHMHTMLKKQLTLHVSPVFHILHWSKPICHRV